MLCAVLIKGLIRKSEFTITRGSVWASSTIFFSFSRFQTRLFVWRKREISANWTFRRTSLTSSNARRPVSSFSIAKVLRESAFRWKYRFSQLENLAFPLKANTLSRFSCIGINSGLTCGARALCVFVTSFTSYEVMTVGTTFPIKTLLIYLKEGLASPHCHRQRPNFVSPLVVTGLAWANDTTCELPWGTWVSRSSSLQKTPI